jgi:long-subunit fatty acid transport protein
VIFILCMSFARGVCAEVETLISIAPEPVGSGARALGQSAFIAVADDATAASWNPAGLINLERPEASFVGMWRHTSNDPSSAGNRVWLDGQSWSETQINFMSYAQPLRIGNTDAVLSVNYHQVYDLGLEINHTKYERHVTRSAVESEGAIAAYSLAGGFSVPSYPQLALGAGVNLYTRSLLNDYTRQAKRTDWIDGRYYSTTTETLDDLRGYNFTLGLLCDVYEEQENLLTLGLVCHTPFTAKVDQETQDILHNGKHVRHPRARLDIDFPFSLGGGVNFRFSDWCSAAFDVQWTEWSEFNRKYTGGTSPPSDTLGFRLGFEQLHFPERTKESVFACREGVFYDPRPAWNDVLPVYGLSAGFGWTLMEQFSLDFAYQFRWGEQDFSTVDLGDFDYGIKEHLFVTSVVLYF